MRRPVLSSQQRGEMREMLNASHIKVSHRLFDEIRNGSDYGEPNSEINNRLPEYTLTMRILDVATTIRNMIRRAHQPSVVAAE